MPLTTQITTGVGWEYSKDGGKAEAIQGTDGPLGSMLGRDKS